MDYWNIITGEDEEPGIKGAIARRTAQETIINTVGVPSVDQFMEKVAEAGGMVATEKMAIPGIGYFAYCVDTEGNTFGIMEADPSAQ